MDAAAPPACVMLPSNVDLAKGAQSDRANVSGDAAAEDFP